MSNNKEGNDTDSKEMALINYNEFHCFILCAPVPRRRSTPIATVTLGDIKLIVLWYLNMSNFVQNMLAEYLIVHSIKITGIHPKTCCLIHKRKGNCKPLLFYFRVKKTTSGDFCISLYNSLGGILIDIWSNDAYLKRLQYNFIVMKKVRNRI